MKKILLSCVTCLLALGLVTACNDEDEVVENDGTTQDTGTSGGSDTGSGGTTQGGGAEEVTSLSNYTLSFTLTGEEIPDYATLYITGDFNEWGFEALEVGEGVYTYTFDTITVDWHNFKLVMWYTDEEVSWEGDNYVEVVNEPWIDENGETQYGNAYFEVTASQGDGYTLELTYEVSATLEEKIVSVTGVSISEGSPVVVAPEGTVQLHAVVTPSNATDPSVTWAVKEESDTEPTDPVVSVDQTGLVTAGANMGTATVEVTTTDGGHTAETVVYVISAESIIENYTLTITLGEGVTIPEYAELYLSYNGAYTLLEFSEGTATASLGSVVIGNTISYSVYIVYSEDYRELEECPEVTESNIALSESHTVAEGETGVSGEITSVPTLVDPNELASEITVYFHLYQDDECTIPETLPTYLNAYIGWSQDNWATKVDPNISGTGKLSAVDDEDYYSYTFKDTEVLSLGTVYYTMYFELTSATEITWSHQVTGLTFTVPHFTATGNPIEVDVVVGDLESQILDPNDPTNVCSYIIGFKNTVTNSGTYNVSNWYLYGGEAGLDWSTKGTLTQDSSNDYGCDYYYTGSGHKGENISIALYPENPSDSGVGWNCRLCGASGEINPTDYSEEPYWISGAGSSDSKLNCGEASWMAEANLVCMIIEFDFSQFSSSSYALVTNVTVTHSTVESVGN